MISKSSAAILLAGVMVFVFAVLSFGRAVPFLMSRLTSAVIFGTLPIPIIWPTIWPISTPRKLPAKLSIVDMSTLPIWPLTIFLLPLNLCEPMSFPAPNMRNRRPCRFPWNLFRRGQSVSA